MSMGIRDDLLEFSALVSQLKGQQPWGTPGAPLVNNEPSFVNNWGKPKEHLPLPTTDWQELAASSLPTVNRRGDGNANVVNKACACPSKGLEMPETDWAAIARLP